MARQSRAAGLDLGVTQDRARRAPLTDPLAQLVADAVMQRAAIAVALVADQRIDRPGIVEGDDGDATFPVAPAQTIDTALGPVIAEKRNVARVQRLPARSSLRLRATITAVDHLGGGVEIKNCQMYSE